MKRFLLLAGFSVALFSASFDSLDAATLPGCPRAPVQAAQLYPALLPGAYLLQEYAQALLRTRNHATAASRFRDGRPLAAVVVEEADHKQLQLVFNFHESVAIARLQPDGQFVADPETAAEPLPNISLPRRCELEIDYRKYRNLRFRYVGPTAERFISDVMFAGIYQDQLRGKWQLHNGIASGPSQSYRYEFGIDLVGDALYWTNGLMLKGTNSEESYEAYLGPKGRVEIFVYETDEEARAKPNRKRKAVWVLRRLRGKE